MCKSCVATDCYMEKLQHSLPLARELLQRSLHESPAASSKQYIYFYVYVHIYVYVCITITNVIINVCAPTRDMTAVLITDPGAPKAW